MHMPAKTPPRAVDRTDRSTIGGAAGRRSWSAEEDQRLRDLCLEGRSQRDIARQLGRAVSSVGCRIGVLGCPVRRPEPRTPVRRRPAWPDDLWYEDDPRAARREPPWRGPVAARSSTVGCAAHMTAEEA
jgi:hypothetical protein